MKQIVTVLSVLLLFNTGFAFSAEKASCGISLAKMDYSMPIGKDKDGEGEDGKNPEDDCD